MDDYILSSRCFSSRTAPIFEEIGLVPAKLQPGANLINIANDNIAIYDIFHSQNIILSHAVVACSARIRDTVEG
jgi:hypothetical protein